MHKATFLLFFSLCGNHLFSQNVGIGTSTPTRAKFEVAGAVGTTVAIFGGDGHGVSIQQSSPAIGFNQYNSPAGSRYMATGYAASQFYQAGTGTMSFFMYPYGTARQQTGTGIEAIRIASDGRVNLSEAAFGSGRLRVGRGTGTEGTAVFRGSTYSSHINTGVFENTHIRGGKAGSYVYINDIPNTRIEFGDGTNYVSVGINRSSPSAALEVGQISGLGVIQVSSNFHSWHFSTGPAVSSVGSYHRLFSNEGANPVGSFHPQTGAYAALSDLQVKDNIQPLGEATALLLQLNPVQFRFVHDSAGNGQLGFLAQELKKLLPGLVETVSDTTGSSFADLHLINYDGLAAYCIQSIQEQQTKIDQLKLRLAALKQRLATAKK